MAKLVKRSLDAARKSPVRKKSYSAPTLKKKKRREVPQEYRTFKKAPKSKGGCLWFLFLLFAAAVAGLIYWNRQAPVVIDNSLEFLVTGPNKIVSGDQISYFVEYKNLDSVALTNMKLSVQWPDGFYFDEASLEPSDANATTWEIADLQPGHEQNLEIKGQLVGPKDEELSAMFSLGYQPENFNSDFQGNMTIKTKVEDSKIDVLVEAIDKTLVESEQEMRITLRNLTEEELSDLYVDILYPDDLDIIEDVPADEEDEETEEEVAEEELGMIQKDGYLVFNLSPEEERTIIINGVFAADSKAEQSLVVEVGNMFNENFRRLARTEKNIVVVNPQFDVNLEINGNSNNQSVNWGDDLRYQLEITNTSDTDVSDTKITALLDGGVLDWDSLETIGVYQESNIIWTSTENEELLNWSAGETKTFTWQVEVVEEPQAERAVENIIKVNIQGLSEWEQVSSPIVLTVGESLAFNNGIYWDLGGRRVGSGLLPPQVGESTQYLAVWSLNDVTGEFDTVNINTTLPPEVSFISETDVQEGVLNFDEEARTLSWSLSEFGDYIWPLTATFIIELEPNKDNQGETMTLFNTTTVVAVGLEEVIVRSKPIKTSDVVVDSDEPVGIVE
ncbi:hypothetical protein HOB10_02490 [Candidatus Parcubacteria bacterium]|jgi:uncharacterized repeat protein (TIGR01451 family)|nr:hypothetical protein [Candidatus Parcubacteria bacterium]